MKVFLEAAPKIFLSVYFYRVKNFVIDASTQRWGIEIGVIFSIQRLNIFDGFF